jgi:hypothetical protein
MEETEETQSFVVLKSGKRNGAKLPSLVKTTIPKPAQPVNPRWERYFDELELTWEKSISFENVKAQLVEMFANEFRIGMEEHQNREDNQRPIVIRSRPKISDPVIEKDNPFYEPVKETVKEPVKETVKEPVKETVKEPVKEPVKDTSIPLIELDVPVAKDEILEPVKSETEPVADRVEKPETETESDQVEKSEEKDETEPTESTKKPIRVNRKNGKGK